MSLLGAFCTESFAQDPWAGFNRPGNIIDVSEQDCVGPMAAGQFKAKQSWVTTSGTDKYYYGFSIPLVGDVDGDGKPEVLALGTDGTYTGLNPTASRIDIISGVGTVKATIPFGDATTGFRYAYSTSFHGSPSTIAIGKANASDAYPCIILTTSGSSTQMGKIACWRYNGSTYELVWSKTGTDRFHYNNGTALTNFCYPMPHIADFDGDGNAELLVYNKIYDLASGTFRVQTEDLNTANVGRRWWYNNNGGGYEDHLGMMAVADLDNDGKVEIAAGNKVYKVVNNSGTWSVTPYTYNFSITGFGDNPPSYYGDGFTGVADMDGDGKLEVVTLGVSLETPYRNWKVRVYAWKPDFSGANNHTLVGAQTIAFYILEGTFGMPFLGDINGDKKVINGKLLPEVCFIHGQLDAGSEVAGYWTPKIHPLSPGLNDTDIRRNSGGRRCFVSALTLDPNESTIENKLKLSWMMEAWDGSQCTGITTFDFANEGRQLVVYRDEQTLRVIDAGVKDYVTLDEVITSPNTSIRMKNDVHSYTAYEYPVVADINGDGGADFITLGNQGVYVTGSNAYMFEGDGAAFVGAPPVWNQFVYFPTLVNNDLSISAKPMPITTVFQKCAVDADGNPTTDCKSIAPYNGTLLQQPIVRNDNFYPAVLMPDLVPSDLQFSGFTANSITISFKVTNNGSAAISNNAPISFYYGTSLETAQLLTTKKILDSSTNNTTSIYPTDASNPAPTLTYTFTGLSFDPRNKMFWIQLTDNGDKTVPATGYYECVKADNVINGGILQANNDAITGLYAGSYQDVDVLANDFYSCTTPTIKIKSYSAKTYAYPLNGKIRVWLDPDATGTVSVTYAITCDGITESNVATASGTITAGPDPNAVATAVWTGAANDQDWQNINNWTVTPSGRTKIINSTDVTIAAGKTNYPELQMGTRAACNKITFEPGAEVGKPMILKYNEARVQLTLPSNRWNMVTPPLMNFYSGDFYHENSPKRGVVAGEYTVYQQLYQTNNPQTSAIIDAGSWSSPFRDLDISYPIGMGVAVWIDDNQPIGSTTNVPFKFPVESITNTQYSYYDANPLSPTYGSATRQSAVLTRTSQYKFAFDTALQSDTTFKMTVNKGGDESYNSVVIGNPLMSHLDPVKFQEANPALAKSFKVLRTATESEGNVVDVYYTYQIDETTGAITSPDETGVSDLKIAPMQSIIFDKASQLTNSQVSITPDMSLTAPQYQLRASANEDNLFRIHAYNGKFRNSSMLFRYNETSSNSFVINEDVWTTLPEANLNNNKENTTMASIVYALVNKNNNPVATSINSVGDLDQAMEIGVSTAVSTNKLKLEFADYKNFPASGIWFEDRMNKDANGNSYIQNIQENPVYEFTNENNDAGAGRFYIYFNPKAPSGTEDISTDRNTIQIHNTGKMITVLSGNSQSIQTVSVYNLQGQLVVFKKGLNQLHVTFSVPESGVYIVKATTEKEQSNRKVLIQ